VDGKYYTGLSLQNLMSPDSKAYLGAYASTVFAQFHSNFFMYENLSQQNPIYNRCWVLDSNPILQKIFNNDNDKFIDCWTMAKVIKVKHE